MSDLDTHNKVPEANDSNGNVNVDKSRHGWVKFDEETGHKSKPLGDPQGASEGTDIAATTSSTIQHPAVLTTETVHVNLERGDRLTEPVTQGTLSKNVEFVNIRHGFSKFSNFMITKHYIRYKNKKIIIIHFYYSKW